jgi:hypothetical protein
MYSAAIIEHAAKDAAEAIYFFGLICGLIAGFVLGIIVAGTAARRHFKKESQGS